MHSLFICHTPVAAVASIMAREVCPVSTDCFHKHDISLILQKRERGRQSGETERQRDREREIGRRRGRKNGIALEGFLLFILYSKLVQCWFLQIFRRNKEMCFVQI